MASSSLSQPPPSPSKRKKLSLLKEAVIENDAVDRISDLPDCLLCHIVSFLPTTEAVTTSILSSRWKTVWTFVPCLYLDDDFDMRLPSFPSSLHERWNHLITFPHIVSRVLLQHKLPYLRKFSLDAGLSCDAFDIDTWFRAAVSPNLEELDMSIYLESDPSGWDNFSLPRSIFNCKNLVVLKLSGRILLKLPSSFKFPSLKILHLCLNPYPDLRVLSGCPVLEDLVLGRDGRDGGWVIGGDYLKVTKLETCVPTLKRLKLDFRNFEVDNPYYLLKINAPALEYFNFIGDRSERDVSFLEKLPNLVEANLDILGYCYLSGKRYYSEETTRYTDTIIGLLRQFYNVKFLSLSHDTTECLTLPPDYELPIFHNLVRLNYQVDCCNGDGLTYLLEQAPNLQVLVLERFPSPSSAPNHQSYCPKEPLYVSDLSPHLTTFCFRGFKGMKDELKFVRCILKKAIILKEMTFGYGGNDQNAVEEKSRILKKVSNFPRRSMLCQFAFE